MKIELMVVTRNVGKSKIIEHDIEKNCCKKVDANYLELGCCRAVRLEDVFPHNNVS